LDHGSLVEYGAGVYYLSVTTVTHASAWPVPDPPPPPPPPPPREPQKPRNPRHDAALLGSEVASS